jgi:ParG
MKRLTIDIDEALHRRLKAGCATRGTKIADVVRDLISREFPS